VVRFAAWARPLPPRGGAGAPPLRRHPRPRRSTLDTVLRHVGLLRAADAAPVAGRIAALLDVATRLPRQVWYEEEGRTADQRFWAPALAALTAGTLLLFDRGFLGWNLRRPDHTAHRFHHPPDQGQDDAGRADVAPGHDSARPRRAVGSTKDSRCAHLLRLAEVRYRGTWYRYLTNVLDPSLLSAEDVAALYRQRWRSEDAFAVVKRLLGLAYFWVGAANGIQT